MEVLSCRVRSFFPEQGVTSHNLITLQRCITLTMRDLILVAQPGNLFPSIHFGMVPSIRSKPITTLLHDPACPPFCFTQATVKPPIYSVSTRKPRFTCPRYPQSIIDTRYRGNLGVPSFLPGNAIRFTSWLSGTPLTCERKKIQLTFSSHFRSHG
jgi:hypothetical protein